MDFCAHLITVICISWLLSQSYNLILGVSGQFQLGHVATYAIGAYISALLTVDHQVQFEVAIMSSGIGGALFALIISACVSKLKGDYFALGTLAFNALVLALLINLNEVTHGVLGIQNIPRPAVFGHSLNNSVQYLGYVAIWSISLLGLLLICFRAPFSRCLRACRDNPLAAASLGIHATASFRATLMLGSSIAGIAGGLLASLVSYIEPSSFQLGEMVFILASVALGMPGKFWGCIGATTFLIILPEVLALIELPSHFIGPLRQLLNSIILYAVLVLSRGNALLQGNFRKERRAV